jgi:hypothetical protein
MATGVGQPYRPGAPRNYDLDEPMEAYVTRRARRNGGKRHKVGAYKGSRFAKRASKRGGNPAAHG